MQINPFALSLPKGQFIENGLRQAQPERTLLIMQQSIGFNGEGFMKIMGHRGARHEAPENTLAGFAHLRQLGIHRVELDLQLSKDNQLIVIHDSTLDRTTSAKGKVSDYSVAELEKINVPTLEKVLSEWPELQTIQLEVKSRLAAEYAQVIDLLAPLINRFKLKDKATITSSDQEFLQASIARLSDQAHGYIAEPKISDPLDICLILGCSALVAHYSLCKELLMAKAQENQLCVSAWTVNDVNEMHRLEKLGIDFLITDMPSVALKELG